MYPGIWEDDLPYSCEATCNIAVVFVDIPIPIPRIIPLTPPDLPPTPREVSNHPADAPGSPADAPGGFLENPEPVTEPL